MNSQKNPQSSQVIRILLKLVGLALLVSACSSSTSVTSNPTQQVSTSTPLPTITEVSTETSTAIARCDVSQIPGYSPPSGQLPPHVIFPPNSLVSQPNTVPGYPYKGYELNICTSSGTESDVVTFMNSMFPANGWKPITPTPTKSCYRMPPYQWIQGSYGITLAISPISWNGSWGMWVCTPI